MQQERVSACELSPESAQKWGGQTEAQIGATQKTWHDVLADLRTSAYGIVSLYNQIPALQSAHLKVYYYEQGQDRIYGCSFNDVSVSDGYLPEHVDLIELECALEAMFVERDPFWEGFDLGIDAPKHPLLSEQAHCLFTALDVNDDDLPQYALGVDTSRAQIAEALMQNKSVDAVAAALFPERWAQVARHLDVPSYLPLPRTTNPSKPRH